MRRSVCSQKKSERNSVDSFRRKSPNPRGTTRYCGGAAGRIEGWDETWVECDDKLDRQTLKLVIYETTSCFASGKHS